MFQIIVKNLIFCLSSITKSNQIIMKNHPNPSFEVSMENSAYVSDLIFLAMPTYNSDKEY
jgi:hypothetical protein